MQAARGAALTLNETSPGLDQPSPGPDSAGPDSAGPDSAGPDSTGRASGRKRIWLTVSVAVAVLICDVITKVVVVATLSDRAPIRLLGGFLTLLVTRNAGAAFSIGGPSTTVIFALIAAGVITFLVVSARRIRSLPWAIALGLLLGGAAGNFTDRMLRSPGPFFGQVVDWIEVPHWPVFNVADSAITCGGILCVLLVARGIGIDGSRAPGRSADGSGGDESKSG